MGGVPFSCCGTKTLASVPDAAPLALLAPGVKGLALAFELLPPRLPLPPGTKGAAFNLLASDNLPGSACFSSAMRLANVAGSAYHSVESCSKGGRGKGIEPGQRLKTSL
jgi:hypothetical protein